MTEELEKKLYEKYPKLFSQKDLGQTQTCMYWGIECDDGWFKLLDQLCETIQNYIDWNKKTQTTFSQVKEKFGSLRVYTDGADELINGMIWFAENISRHTCEVCGEEGTINDSGWLSCRCEKHKEK